METAVDLKNDFIPPQAELKLRFFPFGGQYAPSAKSLSVPPSEWDQDIGLLRELGMNTFRVFVTWNRVETEEGKRNFSEIDYAFDLAKKHGAKVIANIGGVFTNLQGLYSPAWLARDCHCQCAVPHATDRSPEATPLKLCWHDPVYRRKASDFLAETVARFAKYDELFAWNIWNEPSAEPCYCKHTVSKYREWLQARYSDLAELNRCWSDEFPIAFRSWEEIEPQTGVGFLHGGYAGWHDWNAFIREDLLEQLRMLKEIVRKNDPKRHLITANIIHDDFMTKGVYRRRMDPWELGDILDIPSMSVYTFHLPTEGGNISNRAALYSRIRSTSSLPGKPWLTMETEAGPKFWVHDSKPTYTALPERILSYWHMVAHGSKSLLHWIYRTRITNAQAGEFGLLGWDGSATERARVTGELSRLINKHADVLQSRYPRSDVAILVSESARNLYATESYAQHTRASENFGDFWDRSWFGAYRMLWESHIPADFIEERHVSEEVTSQYKAILIPFHLSISSGTVEKLRRYVEAGGTILADFPFGFKDQNGLLLGKAPGFNLHRLFGGYTNDALPASGNEKTISCTDGSKFPAQQFYQEITVEDGEAIGSWDNGSAAIVSNRAGKGRAILAGTMLFMFGYDPDRSADENRKAFVLSVLTEANVTPLATVRFPGGPDASLIGKVEVCALHSLSPEEKPVYFVFNHSEKAVQCDVMLARCATERVRELIHDRKVTCVRDDGSARVTLNMPAKSVQLLMEEA